MRATSIGHDVTVWMVDDIPVRMIYAGQRWAVTDTPTRLHESVWPAPLEEHRALHGWRFQATDPAGATFVFDVYRQNDQWHVHPPPADPHPIWTTGSAILPRRVRL